MREEQLHAIVRLARVGEMSIFSTFEFRLKPVQNQLWAK